jgi:hypothetical protein
VPFLKDHAIQLAPGLIWCGEMNILPTATNPLSRLEDYNGRASNIIPHAVHALESIASLPDEATKFNYATGAITLRNYIQKRAGIWRSGGTFTARSLSKWTRKAIGTSGNSPWAKMAPCMTLARPAIAA